MLRQTDQHDTGATGASLVRNLELVTALRKDCPFRQRVECTANRSAAGIREAFEGAPHRRLKTDDQAQRAAQIDGASGRELGVAAWVGAAERATKSGGAAKNNTARHGRDARAGRYRTRGKVDRAGSYTEGKTRVQQYGV